MTDVRQANSVNPELQHHIDQTPLVGTHDHQASEKQWIEAPGDVLSDLFGHYVASDVEAAGAPPGDLERAMNGGDPDLAGRWNGIKDAWEKTRFTGYGEAVRILAKEVYGIDEITVESLKAAQPKLDALRRPGERYRLLKEMANLDHVQIDNFCWACPPDPAGPEFFLYDINFAGLCSGDVSAAGILEATGIEVKDLASLRQGIEGVFDKFAPCAIAVKAQHAYGRTLRWHPRTDAEVEPLVQKQLKGKELTPDESLVVGDWNWALVAELCAAHNLPLKLHTGYYAGLNYMVPERIRAGNLWQLMRDHPRTRFVLMHIAYPYYQEAIAMAKHYTNAYVDLCWAWGIDPYASMDLVRRFIHAAPIRKLFAFGGDTFWPTCTVAYAIQARRWLARALSAEVNEGLLTLDEAKEIAARIMRGNQYECFDVEGTRSAIRKAVAEGEGNS